MATPSLRPSSSADRAFVGELSAQAFAALGDYRELLPSWLAEPGVLGLVAEDEHGPCGFVLVGFYYGDSRRSFAYADLLALAVSPAARRQGCGRQLLAAAIEAARRGPGEVRELRLTVAEENAAARALFASCGFAELAEEPGRYDGGQRALRLGLQLLPGGDPVAGP